MARVGKPLIDIDVPDATTPAEPILEKPSSQRVFVPDSASATAPTSSATESEWSSNGILATPAVRRIGREHNVDLRLIVGTGKDGRISKEDVLQYVQSGGTKGE